MRNKKNVPRNTFSMKCCVSFLTLDLARPHYWVVPHGVAMGCYPTPPEGRQDRTMLPHLPSCLSSCLPFCLLSRGATLFSLSRILPLNLDGLVLPSLVPRPPQGGRQQVCVWLSVCGTSRGLLFRVQDLGSRGWGFWCAIQNLECKRTGYCRILC